MDVSKTKRFGVLAVALWSIGAFGVGAVISWLAFGAPRGVDLAADSGSTADWIAALGTWAVGVAAAWVGWLSHKLQLTDRKARKRDDARMTVLQLRTMRIAINNARGKLNRVLRGIDRHSPEFMSEDSLKEVANCAATLSWDIEEQHMFGPVTRALMLRVASHAQSLPVAKDAKAEEPNSRSAAEEKRVYINALTPLVNELGSLEDAMRGEERSASARYKRLAERITSGD